MTNASAQNIKLQSRLLYVVLQMQRELFLFMHSRTAAARHRPLMRNQTFDMQRMAT